MSFHRNYCGYEAGAICTCSGDTLSRLDYMEEVNQLRGIVDAQHAIITWHDEHLGRWAPPETPEGDHELDRTLEALRELEQALEAARAAMLSIDWRTWPKVKEEILQRIRKSEEDLEGIATP